MLTSQHIKLEIILAKVRKESNISQKEVRNSVSQTAKNGIMFVNNHTNTNIWKIREHYYV